MIVSFKKDERTRMIFDGEKVQELDQKLYERARRRLQVSDNAPRIEDLYFPPSNKLHALGGYDPTRYAIRVNEQWRISFEWSEGKASEVLFEDYH